MIQIVRGNATTLRLKLCRDGVPVDNLHDATKITFMVRKKGRQCATGAAIIEAIWEPGDPGTRITIDDPAVGYVKVALTTPDTTVAIGEYLYALQVEWGVDQQLEWTFDDGKVAIVSDLIA